MNLVPWVLASFAGYVLGAIWYGPLFGNVWKRLVRLTPKRRETLEATLQLRYLGALANAVVMAGVVGVLLGFLGWSGWRNGMIVGFWLWLGFVAPVTFSPVLWQGQPVKAWLLHNGYYLLTLLVMGVIMA